MVRTTKQATMPIRKNSLETPHQQQTKTKIRL